MLTNKVILTYKRKRFSAHSDHGVHGDRASNAPKVAHPVNLDEDRTNNEEWSVADSISNKKQFTLKDYSCTKSGPELGSHEVKEKPECQLPDLNMTGSPSSVHLSISPDRNRFAEFPEKAIVTQVISGKADNHNELLPETGSCVGFSGETVVNEIASTYTGSSSEVNVNIARSEAVPRVTPLITFTRRTKMKNHLDKTYIMNDTVDGDVKNVIYKPIKDEQEDNKKGLFYRRREKLLHTSEKDMVDYIEDAPMQHSQELLQTENVANAGSNLKRSAAPCEVNGNMDLQLSDHSELVECDKEERHDKLKSMWSSTSISNNIDHGVTRSKQNDIGNTVERNTVLDSSHNMNDSHIILEQLVATSAVENALPAANTAEKIGGSQWLKLPLETFQLSQREGTTCPSTREGDINNRQDHRFQASTLSHAKLDWSMPCELEHRLKTHNAAKFQERMFISNFPDGRQEIPHLMEKSSICTNLTGLATSHIDPNSSSISNLGSMAKPVGLHSKENPDSQFLFGNSQLSKAQVVDNILSGTRMLNQRQGLSLGFRKRPSNWSDEELDSLWIGVRRHGRNNWNAILRDPRLYFQDGRTPKDLVERWELEQTRLFSSIQFPSLNLGPRVADTMIESLSSNFQTPRTETQLSLGNAYLQKSDNYMNRKLFQSPPDPRASSSTVGSVSYLTDDYTKKSFWRANARNQKQAHVHRPSALERTTSVRTNVLPHWLKEVVSAPSLRPSELPPQPAFDPRRGILKRNMACTGLNYAESPLANEALAGGKNLFDLNRNSPEQGDNRNDLVIIESDVSSEETISDDGRG